VCDDECGRCCDRKLENKIIVWVWQEWPPSEKHLLVISQLAKAVHNPAELISREMRKEARPQNDRLIFKNEGDRHGNTDIPGTDRPEDLKAGSPIGSESRHKD
jgi:hypothetical protein